MQGKLSWQQLGVIMADEVPPLEDVPAVLEKIQRAEDQQKMTKESAKMPNSTHEEGAKIASQERGALEAEGVKKSGVGGQKVQRQRESTGFGGLKKGFLFGGGAKQSKPKKAEVKAASDLPLIRAQPEKSSLVIKEVQEAMDANHAMEFQDQLAKRLEANPKVADVIADPVWIPILDELQRDPEGTLAKYRHDPAIMHTLRELCNVLGDTFLNMDNKGKEGGDLVSSSYAEAPGVPEALADPLVKQLMEHMKAGDNQEVQRCVWSANPSQKKRIQTLVDVGLFKFTMEI